MPHIFRYKIKLRAGIELLYCELSLCVLIIHAVWLSFTKYHGNTSTRELCEHCWMNFIPSSSPGTRQSPSSRCRPRPPPRWCGQGRPPLGCCQFREGCPSAHRLWWNPDPEKNYGLEFKRSVIAKKVFFGLCSKFSPLCRRSGTLLSAPPSSAPRRPRSWTWPTLSFQIRFW